jgi:hypothetical protein
MKSQPLRTDSCSWQTTWPSLFVVYDAPARAAERSPRDGSGSQFGASELDPLNLAERLAAHIGEWVGALSELWVPGCGPFFAADGQIAASATAFAVEAVEHTAMPAL